MGNVLYAVNANNDLLWYRHEGYGNGKFEWTDGTTANGQADA